MKKIVLEVIAVILLSSILLAACSSGDSDNAPLMNITGKIVRVDYVDNDARYFFDSGAWVMQPMSYPGINLGSIYKVTYREGKENRITSITLVEK